MIWENHASSSIDITHVILWKKSYAVIYVQKWNAWHLSSHVCDYLPGCFGTPHPNEDVKKLIFFFFFALLVKLKEVMAKYK